MFHRLVWSDSARNTVWGELFFCGTVILWITVCDIMILCGVVLLCSWVIVSYYRVEEDGASPQLFNIKDDLWEGKKSSLQYRERKYESALNVQNKNKKPKLCGIIMIRIPMICGYCFYCKGRPPLPNCLFFTSIVKRYQKLLLNSNNLPKSLFQKMK